MVAWFLLRDRVMTIVHSSIRAEGPETCQGKHILLVDDDPALLAYVTVQLTRSRHIVTGASDAYDALNLLKERLPEEFDLLITDLKMSHLSGLELIKELRSRSAHIPVLVVTGFLDAVSLKELQQIERLQLLVKPFKPEELLHCVDELTGAASFSPL